MQYNNTAGEAMNQVYFRVKANLPLATTLSTELRDQYWSSYALIIANSARFHSVKSRRVDPGTSIYVDENILPRAGLVVANTHSDGLCNIIVLRHANQDGRTGRMYSPWPPSGAFLNGEMDLNHVGRLNNCINGLNARYKQGGNSPWLEQVVKTFSPVLGHHIFLPVLSYDWRNYMGWQRSRVRGRGI